MTENLNGAMELDGEPAENDLASDQSIVGSDEMDSDSDDTAQQEEWKRKKQLLEEKIKKDKTDYYAYVELIDVLKSLGELDELRKVRESFSAQYPLTPELWLSWIEDERNLASSPEEKQHVQELFERALQDYLSVDIWLEYAQYSIGLMSDNNHVETVRSIMERSLSIAGLHASKGKLLWEVYREFEMIVLLSLKEGNPSGEDTEAIKTQKKRIGEIMRRQLSVPLMDMEGTYQEVRQWFDEEKAHDICDMEAIESGYKKALDKLSRILTFEESLLCSEIEASLSIYQNYLEFEKRPSEGGNDLFRVKCLYERALTDHPLNASLWRDYIQYLSAYAKVPEDILSVCYRAVRNCPSEGVLWKYYMVELERCNKPKLEITEIFNKSLENVYTNPKDSKALWLSYIYYLLRQLSSVSSENEKLRESNIEEIRAVFNMASENLVKYFGAEGDPECDILQLWARFEAETAKDLESYRKLWTNILDFGYKTSIVYWTKYINMEWQYGDAKHLRRLCERALTALVAVPECPSSIVTLWTEFESLKGSLDSFVHCQRICDEKMKQYNAERGKIKERFNDKKNKNPVKDKKKIKGDDKHVFAKPEPKTSENKGQTSVKKSHSPSKTDEPATKQKKPNTPVETAPPPGTVPAHDSSKDDRTVFISNLDYTVTEEDVKKILTEVGTVEEFRLVRDFKGRSKGYGYMVFSNKNEAVAALKKDRTPVNQRPMFISECDPDRQTRKTGLRFNTGLEKNKLFVKGLPLNLNKEDIENIFKPYGTLVDVRLVTYRNGHSKGLAYVEFENETSAAHALLKTDGLEIGDKTISVAISNPPERKNNASLIPSISEIALGGGSSNKSELGQRGRGRTQLSFIPRAVQVQPSESNDMDVSNGPATTTDKKPATNEDFRNAIFGNKTKTKNIF